MRYLTIVIIAMFLGFNAQAQTYEVGLYAGGSNFIGDVGSTSYIAPNSPVIGGIFKWNRSTRHSFRFTALFTQLESADSQSDESRRQLRGYSFKNSVKEVSLGLEYTFWDFDMFNDRNPSTPYLYTGFTYFNHDELALNGNNVQKTGTSWDFAIPMVLGYKAVIGGKFVLAFEVGARYALTDNLDGSAPEEDANGTLRFGNINNDDWYMFTGFTLTYTFGRKPCFCAF
ncbi:DUF6089 family protein [Dokdonia ponticola]|uniref:DUF6089 family protein n=1 Tax=Dokdonia ponticola TaxID=2041041 RepID=A0ABV9HUW9_9FLAO